jgi:hypothetical protein
VTTIEANLLGKCERFCSFLIEHGGPILQAEVVAVWGDVEWQRVADWMNELNPERVETLPRTSRRLIVNSLRRRLSGDDPFAGLPS